MSPAGVSGASSANPLTPDRSVNWESRRHPFPFHRQFPLGSWPDARTECLAGANMRESGPFVLLYRCRRSFVLVVLVALGLPGPGEAVGVV